MFSQGQWIFAACFLVGFIALMFFSYQKDTKLHKKYYKGSFWVLIGFLLFIALLFGIKTYLR